MVETAGMQQRLSIGEFSKLTHLSVKTLRHYHDVGVVVPAEVDPLSGYRRYLTDQVGDAHLVRRLRAIDMPLAEVRIVLEAPHEPARNQAILTYLERMERDLAQAQMAVASLRALLAAPVDPIVVEYRRLGRQRSLTVSALVSAGAVSDWCAATFPLLYAALESHGGIAAGPGGAFYAAEFFETGTGPVIAYVPTTAHLDIGEPDGGDRGDRRGDGGGRGGLGATGDRIGGGIESIDLAPTTLAVALHRGSFDELDRTYGALGSYVAARDLGIPGPIREHYLVTPDDTDDPDELRTEVAWPIRDVPEDPTQPMTANQ
jgi:DNA-binding transcriptional MerR regulator